MWGMRVVGVLGVGCAVALGLGLAGCGGSDRPLSGSISGLVASEAQPLLRAWAARFERESGVSVRLDVAQLSTLAPDVADFALDDGTSTAPEALDTTIAVPIAVAEVAVAYNLVTFSGRRIFSGLQLDGHTIASIYKGPTFNWHQKVVLALNPGVEIPDELIGLCRYSGTSATTSTFTSFLARSGPNWAHDVGIAPHIQWPHAYPPSESTNLARCVQRASGGFAYVTWTEARRLGLTVAAVQEARGEFRLPGEPGYPIAAPLDVLVWRDLCRAGSGKQTAVDVKAWLTFVLGPGQAMLQRAGYEPLPAVTRARARTTLAQLTCHGRPIAVPR